MGGRVLNQAVPTGVPDYFSVVSATCVEVKPERIYRQSNVPSRFHCLLYDCIYDCILDINYSAHLCAYLCVFIILCASMYYIIPRELN